MPVALRIALVKVLTTILLAGFVVGILTVAGVHGFKAAIRLGNEAAVLQDLKTIAAVEVQYFNSHNQTFGTFDQMVVERMLSRQFSGTNPTADSGYYFTLKVTPRTVSEPASFTLNADPENERTGGRHFFIDSQSGSIHVNTGGPASAADPPLGR